MEEKRQEAYLANLAILAELTQQQDEAEGSANAEVSLTLQKQATSKTDTFMGKKVKDLTKSLQTIAESCKLAAIPPAESGEAKTETTIIDAFASLTDSQYSQNPEQPVKLESMLEEKIKKRAMQNNQLPIAYNTSMVAALVKQSQQSSQLAFYEHFVTGSLSLVEQKARDVTCAIEGESSAFADLQKTAKACTSETQSSEMVGRHLKYQAQVNEMQWQSDVLGGLGHELSLTNEDRGNLFEQEKIDSKQLVEESISHGEFAANQQLAQLHNAFFQSLERVNRIQHVCSLFTDSENATSDPSSVHQQQLGLASDCQLVRSIADFKQYVEDSAYVKLVKQLKENIRLFETPLESMPEFLTFLKVTMKILREKSRELYSFMVNELVKSRARYIDLSFQENVALIFAKQSKQGGLLDQQAARKVALLLAWLHQALINEVLILENTALDPFKYIEVLNMVFDSSLASQLKARIENEIKRQEADFSHCFELFYLLMVFKISLPEQCFSTEELEQAQREATPQASAVEILAEKKLGHDKRSILGSMPDLRMKALQKFAESADTFLAKLRNMFFSQQSFLQVERFVKLALKVIGKVFELVEGDAVMQKFASRRIFMYAITRVLPSVTHRAEDFLATNISKPNLANMLHYYKGLSSEEVVPAGVRASVKDELKLAYERRDFLIRCSELQQH